MDYESPSDSLIFLTYSIQRIGKHISDSKIDNFLSMFDEDGDPYKINIDEDSINELVNSLYEDKKAYNNGNTHSFKVSYQGYENTIRIVSDTEVKSKLNNSSFILNVMQNKLNNKYFLNNINGNFLIYSNFIILIDTEEKIDIKGLYEKIQTSRVENIKDFVIDSLDYRFSPEKIMVKEI